MSETITDHLIMKDDVAAVRAEMSVMRVDIAAIKVELLELRRQFEKLTWLGGIPVVLKLLFCSPLCNESHLQNPNGTSRAKYSDLIFGDVSASDTSSGHLQHF